MTRDNQDRSNAEIVLVGIYVLMSLIWLLIAANNAYRNFTGNRTIFAVVVCCYLAFMVTGLIQRRKLFALISAVNFSLGAAVVGWVSALNWPEASVALNAQLALNALLVFGVVGLILSIWTLKTWQSPRQF